MQGSWIDLRSDTVTWPTVEMRAAMAAAAVGDDVYGDDPTVLKLEQAAARRLGKEAALFVASGTMGNQLALLCQVNRGDEVILSERCHIVQHEAGAAAFLSGAQLRCLPTRNGHLDLDQVEQTIRHHPEDLHSPRSALICIENADSDGYVLDLEYQRELSQLAKHHQVPVHLDGARLFNAAAVCGHPADVLASCADTVQICLSKGLCAPVGSVLVGTKPVIDLARRRRKILGGGMRQVGVLAAAGLLALDQMSDRLGEDHRLARQLEAALDERKAYAEVISGSRINMVFCRFPSCSPDALVGALSAAGIRINPPDDHVFRFVTHHGTDENDLQRFLDVLDRFFL